MDKPLRNLRDPNTLRMLVRSLPVGVYITSSQGEIVDANPGCLAICGVASVAALRHFGAADLYVDPALREEQLTLLRETGSVTDFELQLRHQDSGRVRTVLDTCYAVEDLDTGETLFHGILVDITDRKHLEGQLRELTIRDPLTGCFNRRYLYELEPHLVAAGGEWGVIATDIDHFKQINDRHGHRAGDAVLVRMARYLMRQVRAEDAVVRMGGDEFVVLLVGEAAASTGVVAQRMLEEDTGAAPAPFSLGWSLRSGDEALEQTIHRADNDLIQVRIAERGERRRGRSPEARVCSGSTR